MQVTIHGERIKMLKFADDIVLLAERSIDLENILNGMEEILSIKYRMRINKNKTEVVVCNRCEDDSLNINIGQEEIEEVREFCSIRSKITKDGRSKRDISSIE